MANVILCFCLVFWQLLSTGCAKQFCACIRFNGGKLEVLDCYRCDGHELPEPDDYRRYTDNMVHVPHPRPPGHSPQGPPEHAASNVDSLVNAVKNTIERRATYPRRRNSLHGSCHVNDQFVFKSGGDLCRLLSDISTSYNKKVDQTTTYIPTTTTFTKDSITVPGKANTSRESQSANKHESGKRRKDDYKDDDSGQGVSAGIVAAIAIITFILGLLTMWLVMKFCLEGVIQRLRHRRNSYKTTPRVPNVPISDGNTNAAEPTNATINPALPYSESNRTSYEGLRPENRTSSVYNAIDPDYQSAEQNSTAPAAPGTNEYFVLEKENQDSAVTTPKDNRIDNNANPALTNADYFVLEQDTGVYPRNNSTAGVDGNKDSGTSSEIT